MHVRPPANAVPVRMVVVTMDSHMSSAMLAAEAQVRRDIPGLTVALHTADDWGSDAEALESCLRRYQRAPISLSPPCCFSTSISAPCCRR